MAAPEHIIQDAIDKDVASGRLVPIDNVYKVTLDIDIDVEELLDAVGIDYERSEFDDTQNVVSFELDYQGFEDVFEQAPLCMTNECTIATALLNHELGECCTRVEVLMPSGDTIIFK